MSLKFPFEYAEIEGLGKLFYPMVKFELKTIYGWKEFEFLVDTGADVTTVPSHILPVLGIKKSQLKVSTTLGVGGIKIKTWEFKLPVRMDNAEILVAATAVDVEEISIPLLLGRKDIFEERFNLLLDSENKIVVIEENKKI
ncbi:hypothetical protein COX03_02365 [Candidatus Woesebacteria bacterium CG22_combo_CG10-13_8_21_14_all_39_10]|uniref:Peptidase A2 domain-containing protein n=4 Tax=Candidatus Woeseibacteriota TaxID=1752722 RepID=A0A2M7X9N4_9BACT|nr:MAG: hypothetical protein COX03_02365 [Candidatus Woesebacteria bacterium CG22_combo_CG10-13_8_21_14_all_39_10]PIU71684.1 MAG: hypothetical protein COS80_01940 [Candidatus Woesebacteria bacterium CG06_land_8_20_14_3_00_39_27]PIZ49594.1 MAG: hypothetical protein COY29_01525 [Candidatus Woesebacteria bacterium CG_4_10_14_0_2_um_filter_39_14]PJA42848.1 MAG: hypothetical protein CO176_01240 [Candidatus Woesebacteria bacterium CG_4_9_14_3_um_filter_39_10]